jgi:NAD-dependent DNA ligase
MGKIPSNVNADPDNLLFGLGVSFTGTLESMTREVAWIDVGECGGSPMKSVTKQTKYLVLGIQDSRRLAPGKAMSAKVQRAVELQEAWIPVEVIGEDDFLAIVQEVSQRTRGSRC